MTVAWGWMSTVLREHGGWLHLGESLRLWAAPRRAGCDLVCGRRHSTDPARIGPGLSAHVVEQRRQ